MEGDGGHLFNENLGEQRWRTMVRGSCVSYMMPWEDILRELRQNCEVDGTALPRPSCCLKYLLRVHLNVAGHDMEKHIRGLRVRPFVLVKLLCFLIDREHEAFQGKGSAQELKEKMRRAVEAEYPETESQLPEDQREGEVPSSLWQFLREAEEKRRQEELTGEKWDRRLKLFRTKNATPGDAATCVSKCLDEVRPMAMCLDRNNASSCNPAEARENTFERFGSLHVQTGSKWLSQWCPQYFSQVLPFVIPRMVSGPDFREEAQPWRRQKFLDAPRVPVQTFVRAFARRVEAVCRTDWTALPILRSVSHKFTAEHTMSTLANFCGKRGWTADTKAAEFVKAAQSLYRHLHHGFVGQGMHRIPIAGDTSKLPLASGLTALEKRLAYAQHFLAKNMQGSQQLRQVMGHCHFGARVNYGDCLFFTISPNEQHSALVLRLSRFRRSDPYIKHQDPMRYHLAQQDFPSLERKERKRFCTAFSKSSSACSCSMSGNRQEMDIEINLPEYDLRKVAAARDPLAVMEAYKLEVYLRLATLLGVRMCPHCPACNNKGLGCQDRFGSNMRPMGGVLGGMCALGGATEHQGSGTPHFHAEGHVVCAYEFDTMAEIQTKFEAQKITLESWKKYNSWLHREEVFDADAQTEFAERVDAEFFERFAKREHDAMSVVPDYLQADAEAHDPNRQHPLTVNAAHSEEAKKDVEDDGKQFLQKYYADAQFVFSRVQHHCHQKTAKGYVPFKACRVKGKGKRRGSRMLVCKAGFPMTKLVTPVPLLVCRGLAKKFGLRVSGRRNRFGSMIGKRSCQWQSATHPAFAIAFRSNTHTLPNFRAPLTAATHEDGWCCSKACKASLEDPQERKRMAIMAQRACRECTGYHSGYTFKRQPIGIKYLDAAAETLNYVQEGMEKKTANAQYHYITHRMLQDMQHRCTARTAVEETNLAANWDDHDVKKAEFIRTYRTQDFPGGVLLRRFEAEMRGTETRDVHKELPAYRDTVPSDDLYLRCFDDIYGFRAQNSGKGRHLYYLNPWEFLMLWECKPLPKPPSKLSVALGEDDYEPNTDAESDDIVFFAADIPGVVNFRKRWYLQRRHRPMVPAPTNTPMPDQAKQQDKKYLLLSLYMRPWTLQRDWATPHVPHLTDLGAVPVSGPRGADDDDALWLVHPVRSYEDSWRWYIRGHVVSLHAKRLIVQFLAACCGRSSTRDEDDSELDAKRQSSLLIPDNNVSLERIHSIIDGMSSEDAAPKPHKATSAKKDFPEDGPEEEMAAEDPNVSTLVKEALVMTGKLWKRKTGEEAVWNHSDKSHANLSQATLSALAKKEGQKKKKKKAGKKQRKVYQEKAYANWDETKAKDWWRKVRSSSEKPTDEQEAFLLRIEKRCRQEQKEFAKHQATLQQEATRTAANKKKSAQKKRRRQKKDAANISEPLRTCLFGLPGAGKSTCLKLLRSYFTEVLGWEDGAEFQYLASQNTMASLIGGLTLHHWSTIPVNATKAQEKKLGKGAEGDVNPLFLKVQGMRWLVIDEASTASLTILDLLDSYLRRACSRHVYAKSGRKQHLFGGINIIFSGDLWQLPPVKGKAIFTNPFKKGLSAGEQKIAKMFWQIEDGPQAVFELTVNQRAKDKWLQAQLEADRYGNETWEMYCFIHGLPTRNPGSWLPGENRCTCGNARCAQLAEEWQSLKDRRCETPWHVRKAQECHVCQTERKRRCCIIQQREENEAAYEANQFVDAPFVHPFRAPSYHAQHLRSLNFARNRSRRLLWVTAFDKFMNADTTLRGEEGCSTAQNV